MDIEIFRKFCLSLPCVSESTPFDEVTLVYKVGGKIFTFYDIYNYEKGIALKCDPDYAIELRDKYPDDIIPGYHMNKRHWNTIKPLSNLPDSLILNLTTHSYNLVVSSLTRKVRDEITQSHSGL